MTPGDLDLFPPTVYSQNAAFGAVPSFDWLTKYRTRLGQSNPFAEDVFDPLKYMNLEDSNMKVSVSETDFQGVSLLLCVAYIFIFLFFVVVDIVVVEHFIVVKICA